MLTTTTTDAPAKVPDVDEHPAIAELRGIEIAVLTGYTLADAIREGASVTSQKVGGWVDPRSSCAIGAAYLAARARGFARRAA